MRIVDAQLARAVGELHTSGQLKGSDLAAALAQFLRRHRLGRRAGKISRTLEAHVAAMSGNLSIKATTAHPLDALWRKRVTEEAARLLGKSGQGVAIEFHENPALIGGLRLETGDTRYVGSVSRALRELHKSL